MAPWWKRPAYVLATIVAAGAAFAAPMACGAPYGANDTPPAPDAASMSLQDASTDGSTGGDASLPDGSGAVLPECTAQRTVHLVAGNGGLAWFTLLWPVPMLITSPQANDAFDDPAN